MMPTIGAMRPLTLVRSRLLQLTALVSLTVLGVYAAGQSTAGQADAGQAAAGQLRGVVRRDPATRHRHLDSTA